MLANPRGTAAGFWLEVPGSAGGAVIACMPGVCDSSPCSRQGSRRGEERSMASTVPRRVCRIPDSGVHGAAAHPWRFGPWNPPSRPGRSACSTGPTCPSLVALGGRRTLGQYPPRLRWPPRTARSGRRSAARSTGGSAVSPSASSRPLRDGSDPGRGQSCTGASRRAPDRGAGSISLHRGYCCRLPAGRSVACSAWTLPSSSETAR